MVHLSGQITINCDTDDDFAKAIANIAGDTTGIVSIVSQDAGNRTLVMSYNHSTEA